jgi:hypothetical protein
VVQELHGHKQGSNKGKPFVPTSKYDGREILHKLMPNSIFIP